MNKQLKIFISLMLSIGMMMPTISYAAEFPDMPDNWTTKALERAIENGLLKGSDGKILPDNNIKRAEMAAIIVRAFGAQDEADLSVFSDMAEDKWYYSEFSRAVAMNAFAGDDKGKLNPESFITYQECFTVMARVFALKEQDAVCLESFGDYSAVADWAKADMARVVGNGYWEGIENMLKPKDYITRSEFAVLMDNLVETYINEPGTYSEIADGNVLIRSNGVTVEKITTDDLIIVGDSVEDVSLKDITSTSRIVPRGANIVITGHIHEIYAPVPGVVIDLTGEVVRTGWIDGVKGTHVKLGNVDLSQMQ